MKITCILVILIPLKLGSSQVLFFLITEIGYASVSARADINIDAPLPSESGIIFSTIRAHYFMIKFMCFSIKDHSSISSDMVNFVCYSVPSTNTSEFLTRVSTVQSLQRSEKINLFKQGGRLKKMYTFNTEAEKSIKKLKGKAGI